MGRRKNDKQKLTPKQFGGMKLSNVASKSPAELARAAEMPASKPAKGKPRRTLEDDLRALIAEDEMDSGDFDPWADEDG